MSPQRPRPHVTSKPTALALATRVALALVVAYLLVDSWVVAAQPVADAAASVLYVDESARGANDGSSWADAYSDLQNALDAAREVSEPVQVWVAAGTYRPDRGSGDRSLSFNLPGNASLYGGFAGWETGLHQRDWIVHETILSGDLLGDDDLAYVPASDCCEEDYLRAGCDDKACEATVCAVAPDCCDNWWSYCAGAASDLCCETCRTTHCDNSLHVLTATDTSLDTVLDGVVIQGGEANGQTYYDVTGSGARVGSPLTIRNCTFRYNGGGASALFVDFEGASVLEDTVFAHNFGQAVYVNHNDTSFLRCSFLANQGQAIRADTSAFIEDCYFVGNTGGALSSDGAPLIKGCVFIGNGNNSTLGSGINNDGYPIILNCLFASNIGNGGAGVYSGLFGSALIGNSVFIDNYATSSTSAIQQYGSAILFNLTVVANKSDVSAIYAGSSVSVLNSIVWGNTDEDGQFWQGSQIYPVVGDNVAQVDYTCIDHWDGVFGGEGNTGADPRFADPYGPDGVLGTLDDDFRLSTDSPLIDAGDPDPVIVAFADFDGHVRTLCGRVDLGAYEFGFGDYDCDRLVELADFSAWEECFTGPGAGPYEADCEAFDRDTDEDVDTFDFAAWQSVYAGFTVTPQPLPRPPAMGWWDGP